MLWEPAVGWVKRHRRATHHGALGTLNLNEIFSPLCFAKGEVQRSLGHRPRKACGSGRFSGAMPLAMMILAVGQLICPRYSPKAIINVALGNALGMRVACDIFQGRCPWL